MKGADLPGQLGVKGPRQAPWRPPGWGFQQEVGRALVATTADSTEDGHFSCLIVVRY